MAISFLFAALTDGQEAGAMALQDGSASFLRNLWVVTVSIRASYLLEVGVGSFITDTGVSTWRSLVTRSIV